MLKNENLRLHQPSCLSTRLSPFFTCSSHHSSFFSATISIVDHCQLSLFFFKSPIEHTNLKLHHTANIQIGNSKNVTCKSKIIQIPTHVLTALQLKIPYNNQLRSCKVPQAKNCIFARNSRKESLIIRNLMNLYHAT